MGTHADGRATPVLRAASDVYRGAAECWLALLRTAYATAYLCILRIHRYACCLRQHACCFSVCMPLACTHCFALVPRDCIARPARVQRLSQCACRCLAQCRRSLASQRSLRLFARALQALLRRCGSLGRPRNATTAWASWRGTLASMRSSTTGNGTAAARYLDEAHVAGAIAVHEWWR